jgi:protein-tyrosine phosphatase
MVMNQIGAYQLWIGNAGDARDAQSLRAKGITAVLNVATDLVSPPDVDPIRFKVGLTDGPSNSSASYQAAADLLDYLLSKGHKVLLHCHEGRSRSAAVATLWKWQNTSCTTLEDAFYEIGQDRFICQNMNPCHLDNLRKIND